MVGLSQDPWFFLNEPSRSGGSKLLPWNLGMTFHLMLGCELEQGFNRLQTSNQSVFLGGSIGIRDAYMKPQLQWFGEINRHD